MADQRSIDTQDTAGVGMDCEIRIWEQRYRKGQQESIPRVGLESEEIDHDENKCYAIVSRREFDDRNVLTKCTLEINSPYLLEVFRGMVGLYPTVPSMFTEPFELESPFQMLYHYWNDLESRRRDAKASTMRRHLTLLLDFMKQDIGPQKAQCDGMLAKGQVRFAQLWTIFRPNELQYTIKDEQPQLLRLQKTAYEENQRQGKFLEIHCTYTDFDSVAIGEATTVLRIYQKHHFAADSPAVVTDLPVFPRSFLHGQDHLEERLLERGSRFLELQETSVQKYDGLAYFLKEPPTNFYTPDMDDYLGVWIPYHVRLPIYSSGI